MFMYVPDFPGVTICNLNRVNCHNAFAALYSLEQEAGPGTGEDIALYGELLSPEVSDCRNPICRSLQQIVSWPPFFMLAL